MNITYTQNNQTHHQQEYMSMLSNESKFTQSVDAVYSSPWITNLLFPNSQLDSQELDDVVSIITQDSLTPHTVLFLAEGQVYHQLTAIMELCQRGKNSPKLRIWNPSLSSGEFSVRLRHLKDKSVTFVPVATETESLAYRCNYAIIKKYITENCKKSSFPWIYPIFSESSMLLKEDTVENQYQHLGLEPWANDGNLGSSKLACLLLKIRKVSWDQYIEGFKKMISSPQWDTILPNLAKFIIHNIQQSQRPQFTTLQREFQPLCQYINSYLDNLPAAKSGKNLVVLSAKETKEDIMTPYFEGCHQDGSLNLLAADIISNSHEFSGSFGISWLDNKADDCLFWSIQLDSTSPENCGELTAYLQLTLAIVKEFVKIP